MTRREENDTVLNGQDRQQHAMRLRLQCRSYVRDTWEEMVHFEATDCVGGLLART